MAIQLGVLEASRAAFASAAAWISASRMAWSQWLGTSDRSAGIPVQARR
jgi:hypothetical protein